MTSEDIVFLTLICYLFVTRWIYSYLQDISIAALRKRIQDLELQVAVYSTPTSDPDAFWDGFKSREGV